MDNGHWHLPPPVHHESHPHFPYCCDRRICLAPGLRAQYILVEVQWQEQPHRPSQALRQEHDVSTTACTSQALPSGPTAKRLHNFPNSAQTHMLIRGISCSHWHKLDIGRWEVCDRQRGPMGAKEPRTDGRWGRARAP